MFKKIYLLTLITFFTFSFSTHAQLNNRIDSLSYAIGVNIGDNISKQGLQPNTEVLAKAIKDVINKQPLLIQSAECNNFIQTYFQAEMGRKAEANKVAGEKFLLENKAKAGVIVTPSGLQYEVLSAGTGAKPVSTDKVKVHYHGTTIDGTVFDSSVDRGSPATFGVTQVIQGWIEGLQLMPQGSKWRFYIPANLAYGPQGPPAIGPNQVLIFEVELLEIVKEG